MKKLFCFGLYVFIASLIAVSCSNNEPNGPIGDEVAVSFSIDVEAESATRAISDGTGADQLMYGVFDEDGKLVIGKAVKNDVVGLTGEKGVNMTISLAKGNTYRVAFWAQNSECTAYTVSDDMKVSINYEGINNDELRDAFFATTEPFTVVNGTSVSVVLRRPFAQVNVGTWPYDMEQAIDAGVEVAKSSATIEGIANELNLLDGSISGEVQVAYSLSAIPDEDLLVDVDENNTPEVYEYLSMSYLLAGEKSLHEMSFNFTNEDGSKHIVFESGLSSVPIQRNWRTNIVGQILSGDVSFNIKIDPNYYGDILQSGGLYYNFSEDTLIENKYFAFNTNEAATFTSENNNVITMKDVTFSGRIQYIAMGEYRDRGNYVDFTNEMTNVKAENMVVDHPGIVCVEAIDYMAPLVFLRGVSTLNNCVFTGSTTTATQYKDYWGDYHDVMVYDCGVPNLCNATFNDCTVDRLFVWSHAQTTINNSTIKYVRCATHNHSKPNSHLTIGSGAVIDEIVVSSSGLAKREKDANGKYHWVDAPANRWSPSLIIKSGATVKRLDMNHRSFYKVDNAGNRIATVIIEDGANVNEIVNTIDALE